MQRLLSTFFLLFLTVFNNFAQDIPVKKEEKNTYSFKLPDYLLVKDFEFVSAVTTETPDLYLINVRALDAAKKIDENIQGKLLFEINGQTLPVDFTNGLGRVQVEIKGTDKITMRAVDSNVTRTGSINHPVSWSKIGGLLLVVAVLAVVVWQVRKRRNLKNNSIAI